MDTAEVERTAAAVDAAFREDKHGITGRQGRLDPLQYCKRALPRVRPTRRQPARCR
jgi:hypothetical protein